MLAFNRQVILEDTGHLDRKGRTLYEVHEELIYEVNFAGGGLTVNVPKGYVTNLASTPRMLWPIFPPFGRWNRAAVVHDYLCEMAGKAPKASDRQRKYFLADCIFYVAMSELGVPLWRRVLMYRAVRLHHVIGRKP